MRASAGVIVAVGLLFGVVAPACWAAESAGPAPAGRKAFDKTAGDALAWPSPWSVGTTLVYDQHYESSRVEGGATVRIVGSDVTEIVVVQGSDGGVVQRWTGRDPRFTGEGLPEAMESVMEAAVESFRDLALDVALDEDGAYRAITNLEAVAPLYREVLERSIEAGIAAGAGDSAVDEEKVAEYRKAMATMVEALSSPKVLEPELASTPAALNFISHGGLVPGRRYIFEDSYANPLGTGDITARHTLLLEPMDDAPGRVGVEWTSQPDPAGVTKALEAFVSTTFGAALSAEELRGAVEGLSGGAHFSTEVRYVVDVATGRVERMEMVETQHLKDRQSTELTRLTLRQ